MKAPELEAVFRTVLAAELTGPHRFDPPARQALDQVIQTAAQTAADDERIQTEDDARYYAARFADSLLLHAGGAEGGVARALVVDTGVFQVAMLNLCPSWPWCR